ncbi:11325_t:CDS:2 [Dentiscutata erythropus]|uniref:11325_t:CDS:1 n=1 Tax=Dentiscutata erythropus TaxID=1348616 RepID=A0A9N9BHU0_9GLOM|nr:11325_t:CDS:2 [Dentiscutata erythropus]
MYTLRHSPEVMVNRIGHPLPWNNVQQHENPKLLTINKGFFENRKGLESPSKQYENVKD